MNALLDNGGPGKVRPPPWAAPALLGFLSLALAAGCGNGQVMEATPVTCGAGTQVVNNQCTPISTPPPGEFESPLVKLIRVPSIINSQLHIDEVRYRASDKKLFQCAYWFGVLNVSDPANASYLADGLKHVVPNDKRSPGCIHLGWDDTNPNIIYTTHRGNISNPNFITGWDISKVDMKGNITAVQLPVTQEGTTAYEGIDVANGNIFVALNDQGLGVYKRDPATNAIARVGVVGGIGSAWGVVARGTNVFVTDQYKGLVTVDATDPTKPKILGTVPTGGVAHGLVLDGNTAYVAAGSAGVVVVDITDLARPKVIGSASTPGSAERIDYSMGHIFVAAWNDARVYDVTTPASPKFIGAVRITEQIAEPEDGHPDIDTRNLGIAGSGNTMFVGNWYINYIFQLHADRVAPNILLPEEVNEIDFGPVAAGMTSTHDLSVSNQGTAPLTIYNAWADPARFTIMPTQIHLQPGESSKFSLSYKATTGTREYGFLHLFSDDPAQPERQAFVVGNQPGAGVGKPLPDTRMTELDGTDWDSAQTKGKVVLLAYFATF